MKHALSPRTAETAQAAPQPLQQAAESAASSIASVLRAQGGDTVFLLQRDHPATQTMLAHFERFMDTVKRIGQPEIAAQGGEVMATALEQASPSGFFERKFPSPAGFLLISLLGRSLKRMPDVSPELGGAVMEGCTHAPNAGAAWNMVRHIEFKEVSVIAALENRINSDPSPQPASRRLRT